MIRLACTSTALLLTVVPPPPAGAPAVEVVGVAETRASGKYDAASEDRITRGLTVVVRVDGVDKSARYGTVLVTQAKDDTGADLTPANKSGHDAEVARLTRVTRPAGGSVVEDVPAF